MTIRCPTRWPHKHTSFRSGRADPNSRDCRSRTWRSTGPNSDRKVRLPFEEVSDEASERVGGADHESQDQGDMQPADDRHDLSFYAGLEECSPTRTAIHRSTHGAVGALAAFSSAASRANRSNSIFGDLYGRRLCAAMHLMDCAVAESALRSSSSIRWDRG
jgi:hypothetical protein